MGALRYNGVDSLVESVGTPAMSFTSWTVLGWIYVFGAGAADNGIIFQTVQAADPSSGAFRIRTMLSNVVRFTWATDAGVNGWDISSLPWNTWVGFALTMDGSAPSANDPAFYARVLGVDPGLIAQSVSPLGGLVGAAYMPPDLGYRVGNSQGGTLSLDADLGFFQVFDSVLSLPDMDVALNVPGSIAGLQLWLADDGVDLSLNGRDAGTLDNVTVVPGPPGIPVAPASDSLLFAFGAM